MLTDRRAKIVATLGPSTSTREALEQCMKAGLNVARLNFSHGTHADHARNIAWIRELSQTHQAPVTVLQDLQGPKIRVGQFKDGSIRLTDGGTVTLTMKKIEGHVGLIPSDFPELIETLKAKDIIYIDDGLLQLEVIRVVNETDAECKVLVGGVLKNRKGINVPGAKLRAECLTEKDLEDLEFGLQQKVDYVALSFVRFPKDIRKLREIIEARGSQTKICAKIEMVEALENLEEIIRLSDAVMVARGDLAVEVGQTRLPMIQKQIIKMCNDLNKPVITATQMLDSMVENSRPTRAEITDVANAVLDGSDALMLSAESASGKHPALCIRTMHEIILEVERSQENFYKINLNEEFLSVAASIGASASLSALKLEAQAIVCLTTSGKTAQIISGYRPQCRLIAVTDDVTTLNRLEIVWGLQTLAIQNYTSLSDVASQVEKKLIEYGLAKTGDKIVLTLGMPMEDRTKTNNLYIFTLGNEDHKRLNSVQLPLRCQA